MAGRLVTGPISMSALGERGYAEAIVPLQLPLNRIDPIRASDRRDDPHRQSRPDGRRSWPDRQQLHDDHARLGRPRCRGDADRQPRCHVGEPLRSRRCTQAGSIIGTQDPIGLPGDYTEIVNSTRAYAYADYAGLCWLQDCSECDAAAVVTPGFPYTSPIADPAPWYDENDPDSWGFLGVIGLDVDGADNSTRRSEVNMGLSGVGVIGRQYMAPRTMVVRALAIATDECSLQFGLSWLRQQYATPANECGGDALTFFDCCPCVCPDRHARRSLLGRELRRVSRARRAASAAGGRTRMRRRRSAHPTR